jgi:hypothetical protein
MKVYQIRMGNDNSDEDALARHLQLCAWSRPPKQQRFDRIFEDIFRNSFCYVVNLTDEELMFLKLRFDVKVEEGDPFTVS